MPSGPSRLAISTPALADTTGFPADWMATSACVHIIAFVVLLLIPEIPTVRDAPIRTRQTQETQISLVKSKDPPLLASVRSDSSSARPAAAPKDAPSGHSLGSGSSAAMPVVFKGAQHIVSDTPDADNSVQTILQPDLQNPPRLHAPIPVPSIVKIASPQRPPSLSAPRLSADVHVAAPPTPAPLTTPPMPVVQHVEINTVTLTSQATLVDSPKLPVFATAGRSYTPPKQQPPPPSPPSPTASAPVVSAAASPSPAPPALMAKPNVGQDAHNLLVANAVDVQSEQSKELLAEVEIHGRFEVSSNPRLAGVGASSPSESKTASGSGSGSGKGAGASRAKGSGTASGAGSGSGGRTGSGAAAGGRGEGHDAGTGKGTAGGSGHGTAGASGSGAGTGNSNGSGSGNGNGNSPSPFGGMTITGGVHTGVGSALGGHRDVDSPKHEHGSYGMTIISSGASGGGLRDFGVFNDGPVYTVYIDVSSLGIQGTRWSLQYGVSREIRLAHPGVLLSPPFPETQKLPHLPPALVASNVGRLVVVQAMLTPDGALDSIHVLQTPDERFNEPLVASLGRWTFQAASIGSEKVPVKILLGVPIASIMASDPDTSQEADQQPLREGAPRTSTQ